MIAALVLGAHLTTAAKQTVGPTTVPSISVAIVTHQNSVASKTFGTASGQTAYWVGSVTKMLTAVSVLQLGERGKLSLDDPVTNYFPQYPQWSGITIRNLLNHTSGIPNYADDAVKNRLVFKPTTPQLLIDDASKKPLDFKPGNSWAYSNTNYVILGQIVEKLSGMSLLRYEQTHIFRVAGMKHTGIGSAPGAKLATPVVPPAEAAIIGAGVADPSWYYACGDIVSTSQDLAKFDIALMNNTLLSSETFAVMQQALPFDTLGSGIHDGLGVFVQSYGSLKMVGHHGGIPGIRADNELVPKDGFAVIVLGNGEYDTNPLLDAAIADAYPNIGPPDLSESLVQRLVAVGNGLMQGKLDRSLFTPQINTAFTPERLAALPAALATYGQLQTLTLQGKGYSGEAARYTFAAKFSKKAAKITVVIDKNGKIAAYTIH